MKLDNSDLSEPTTDILEDIAKEFEQIEKEHDEFEGKRQNINSLEDLMHYISDIEENYTLGYGAVPREEYERVCKERDAAVADLTMCMHFSTKNNNVCNFCKKDMAEYPNKCAGWSDSCECKPEWRGISKEEADGQGNFRSARKN